MKRTIHYFTGTLSSLALLAGTLSGLDARASCTPAPAGIISWWPGQGNANDIIGTNNGTLSSGATYGAGLVGEGFYLNSFSSYVSIPASSSLDIGANGAGLTLEAWIYPTNVNAFHPIFEWSQGTPGSQVGVHFWLGSQPGDVGVLFGNLVDINGNGHGLISAQNTVVANQFQHVALTYDPASSNATIYLNGVVVAQQNVGQFIPQTSYNLYFGVRLADLPGYETYGSFLGGILDEPSIYSRALSSNEIAAIYHAGSAGKCAPNPVTSTGVPAIFNLSPVSGVNGSFVTIIGTNFNPVAASNIVYFGAVQANVWSATPSNLTVTVPAGATYGPITLTVGGLTAYSEQFFEPTFLGSGTNLTASSFAPSFDISTANGSVQTIIADLDGDGKPDLALVGENSPFVYIYRNISTNGVPLSAASFAPPVMLPFPTNGTSGQPFRLCAVDLDGDGRLDLIACEYGGNRVSVFHNISTPGSLTTNSFEPAFALITGNDCLAVKAADLDGDGRVDIVGLNYADETVSLFKNVGTPGILNASSFAPPVLLASPGGPFDVAIADLNGDGKPDLAVAEADTGIVSIFQNAGGVLSSNSFPTVVNLPVGVNPESVVAADLDGDGNLDIVVGSVQGDIFSIYQNLGARGLLTTNSFGPRLDFAVGGWAHVLAVADFNGDGKPDIAVVGELPSTMSIFQNLSTPGSLTTASFAPPVNFSTGSDPWGIAAGDLDGDGRPDIVFCNYYDSTLQIYQNTMPFGAATAPSIAVQLTNATVNVNGTAVFNVVANGSQPLSYQWSFDGTNLPGDTSATLTLTNVLLAEAGNYSVLVSNAFGSVVSSNALLTVIVPAIPPSILDQTPSQLVALGNPATFGVIAGGTAPLSYFWSRNGVLIPGATNSSYTLASAQFSDSGSAFSCLVTNLYGSASSTNATLKVIDTIANSFCSAPIVITNASYTNTQSTLKADAPGNPVPDCVDGFGHGVWYEFTAPVAGLLIVDTFGSDYDTGLALYTGSCGSLTEVACNDDAGGPTSQVILPTTPGTTYMILAGGYESDAGNLVLHLNYLTPPAFAVQPTNLAVVVSSNAVFSPTLSGSLPMTFQWYFNNTPLVDGGRISGSTNAALAIANVQTNDAGSYQLVASNVVGVTTSSVAVLTPVILPPAFVQAPINQSVGQGSNANFFATVTGTPPFNYQWYLNNNPLADDGVHISGSATGSLTISNLTATDAGMYSLTVTNLSGSITGSAVLTVFLPPAITSQPVGRSVPPGLPTVFTAGVSGIPAPSYQWQLNGTNIPGATGVSYTNPAISSTSLGSYQLLASNLMGTALSSGAQLTFGPVAAWGRNLNNECLPPPGLTNVIGLAGYLGGSFAVRADGTVTAWGNSRTTIPANATNVIALATDGNNTLMALRSDGTANSWSGLIAPPLSNVVSVAMGYISSYALRAEGTFATWGNPYFSIPTGLNHLTAVAAGYSHGLALRSDGTVAAWGTGSATNVPVGLANVTAIAAAANCSLALETNGTVVAWGSGTATNLPAGLTNIVAISAGSSYSAGALGPNLCLAIRANGTVVAWGDDPDGETNPPAALSNLLSVALSASPNHGLALVNDGTPKILQPPVGLTAYAGRDVTLRALAVGAAPLSYQWLLNGTNVPGATNTSLLLPQIQASSAGNYQLFVSNSINTALSLPAPVNVISNATLTFLCQSSVSASNVYQGGQATFYGGAVLGNGPLRYQWFFSPTNHSYTPVAGATNDTFSLNPALAFQSGNYYLAVSNASGGSTSAPVGLQVQFARAWGYLATNNPPVNVTNAIAVAAGGFNEYAPDAYGHYLALGADGKVTAWGYYLPDYGETNVSALSNSFVTAIAAGMGDGLALMSDGTVYAWGYGAYGETNPPAGLNGVVAIACGGYHDLALKFDGTVVGWGATAGASGLPTYGINYGQATNNPAATNVVAIAAGNLHSLALRADGTVVAWGYNLDGTTVVPASATNVIAIAAGSSFSVALRANGTVLQWGNIAEYPVPANATNIVAISAANQHVTALRNDGTVISWGEEDIGPASSNVPPDLANVIAIASGGDHDIGLLGNRAPAFTVQPWSRTVFSTTASVTFSAKCAGVQPVTYQWQLNGTNLPAATNDTLVVSGLKPPGLVPLSPGIYQLIASNAYGVVASKYAQLAVIIPLGVALNTTNQTWTTTGNNLWFGETNTTHDGVSAAQSGDIGPGQFTTLQTTINTNVAGSYTFWWQVSSEPFLDTLQFSIDGVVQDTISGTVNWQQVSVPVAPGSNVLTWTYSKTSLYSGGLDAGWVDQFAFVPAPVITRQPAASITLNQGATLDLSVLATGGSSLGYQWQQNGHPVGGNNPSLILSDAGRAQDGTYFVTVTNFGGLAVSSNAIVQVNVPQFLGAPTLLPNGSLQFTSSDVGSSGGTLSPSDLPNFQAQASTDLINWVTLTNALTLTNGMLQLQDNVRTNHPARFYRIVEQ